MRTGTAWPALTLTLTIGLAGCLAETQPVVEPNDILADASWALRALEFGEDHDHAVSEHHEGLTTPNFEILGWDPLVSPSRGSTGYYFPCGDAAEREDGTRLSVVKTQSLAAYPELGDVSFAVADVTDPARPHMLGELILRTSATYDVALVPDGRYAVAVTYLPKPPDRPLSSSTTSVGAWKGPCTPDAVDLTIVDDVIPHPNKLLLVDLRDPTRPVVVDHKPLVGLPHSVHSTTIDGRTWVAAASLGGANALGVYQFYELVDGPLGPSLAPLSTFQYAVHGREDATAVSNRDDLTRAELHNDVWVTKHPGTGQTIAWIAQASLGILIIDLSDPSDPRLLARWTDYDPDRPRATGLFHSIHPLPELWDGRHFIVTGPELGSRPADQPTGTHWVLDTTDPARPFPVAAWTLPGDVEWRRGGEWSPHYLTVVDRTALITMYHGGLWAVDLSGILEQPFSLPPSVGVFVPHYVSPQPATGADASPWSPMLGDVIAFDDGVVVTFDAASGVYVLRYDASRPMPAPDPWPLPLPAS